MDKNRVKRLADNPYYSMNDSELEELAKLLREEAELEKKEVAPKKTIKRVNKNRVVKTTPTLDKTPGIREQDDVSR